MAHCFLTLVSLDLFPILTVSGGQNQACCAHNKFFEARVVFLAVYVCASRTINPDPCWRSLAPDMRNEHQQQSSRGDLYSHPS